MNGADTTFQQLLEAIPDAVLIVDDAGRIQQANGQAAQLFGYSQAELLLLGIDSLLPERFRAKHPHYREQFMRDPQMRPMGSGLALFGRHKGGSEFPIDIMLGTVESAGAPLAMAVVRDITERKQAEKALRQAHDQLEARVAEQTTELSQANAQLLGIIGSAMDAIITIDAEQQVVLFNAAAEKMFGYSAVEVQGQPLERFIPARFHTIHRQHIRRFGETQLTTRRMGTMNDLTAVRANGSEFPIEASISQVEIAGSRFFTVILRDVTERKQAEETRFYVAAIVDSSSDAIIGKTLAGVIVSWNRGAERMYGYSAEEVAGRSIDLLAPPERAAEITYILEEIRQGRRLENYETERITKAGQRRAVSLNVSPIENAAGHIIGAATIARDITERKQAERDLEASLQRYRDTLDSMLEGCQIIGFDWRYLFINETAVQHGRKTREELLGHTMPEVYPGIEQTDMFAALQRCRDDRTSSQMENEFIYPDGSRRWFELSIQPAPEGIFILSFDITERKRLGEQVQQQLERLEVLSDVSRAFAEAQLDYQALLDLVARKITEALGESCAIRLLSDDGQWLNLAALYDVDPKVLAFLTTQMPIAPLPANEPRLIRPVLQSPEPMSVPALNREQLGAYIKPGDEALLERAAEHSRILIRLSAGGQILGLMSIARRKEKWPPFSAQDLSMARDLADRASLAISNARLFRDIQGLNARLEERVTKRTEQLAELNRDLELAKNEAVEANNAKSEFLSRMSHELRTPLNAILGFAQIMEMGTLTIDQQESISHILSGGRHLLNLINEVLDIARIEAGRLSLSPEPILPAEVLQEALDLIAPLAAQRALVIDLPELPHQYIQADHQRFKQVLLNLLSNAVKYNREGGRVTLACEPVPEAPDRLRLAVSDSGPGIPLEKLGRLFQPFDRLGAEATEVQGTGLGLALSKTLVEAMGGAMGVESEVGVGSTFWVEMPVVEAPTERMRRTNPLHLASRTTQATARTVLYIEDNLSNLRLVEQILVHRPNIRLITAMQGGLSIDLAREHQPDLILLDMNLPDLHGSQVLKELQADARTRAIPVVVISADATPGQVERLVAAGARAYLTKPFEIKQFLEILDRVWAS